MYQALYRKWRPKVFEDVLGQSHITETLKNQIENGKLTHAYLFSGTRGTGKTSTAKILARAVNCENPINGNPCNECYACRRALSGGTVDIIEMDAASNNKVEDARMIRDEVIYTPSEFKYKVYIIDEAHMLSGGAFNALLKTLEEPPSYVIFIMATTESHKIPITIRSRCQKYDFKRIGLEVIYERLMDLLQREGIEAEEKAVRYVAKVADGSMRDALSLLDQCISYFLGQTLTYDKVLDVLGAVDIDVFNELMQYVVANNTVQALNIIDQIIWQGRDLTQFVSDFTWYMRNLMLILSSDDVDEQLDLSTDHLESMKQVAKGVKLESLMRYIRVFSELSSQIRYSSQKRVTLELAVIKLTTPQMECDMDSVLERLRALENRMEEGAFALIEEQLAALSFPRGSGNVQQEAETQPEIDREAVLKKELTPAQYEDMKNIVECIERMKKDEELSNRVGKGTITMLSLASINVGHDHKSIMLSFGSDERSAMAYGRFQDEGPRNVLREIIGELTSKDVEIHCQMKDSLEEKDFSSINLSKMNFPVTVME